MSQYDNRFGDSYGGRMVTNREDYQDHPDLQPQAPHSNVNKAQAEEKLRNQDQEQLVRHGTNLSDEFAREEDDN